MHEKLVLLPSRFRCAGSIYGILFVNPAIAAVNMSWTSIGNAGDGADGSTGYGAVGYAYKIGTYDVTNAQYVDFLNSKGSSNSAGIFNATMGFTGTSGSNITQSGVSGSYQYSVNSTYANMPVVGVTWFDAARFSNWLGNGQGNASMETGAYTLNGASSGIITVNLGAIVYIPNENEWYKAAYYNGASSTYSLYPNGQNKIISTDANYWPIGTGLADVGYGTPSSYGIYGMGGNVYQWNDAVIGLSRGLRGGDWDDYGGFLLASSCRGFAVPSDVYAGLGFRVASVPEPTSVFLVIFGSGVMLTLRKR